MFIHERVCVDNYLFGYTTSPLPIVSDTVLDAKKLRSLKTRQTFSEAAY